MATLRLGTFNLLHGMALTDGGCDPDRLAAAVAEVDADVLAVQEADRAQDRSGGVDQTGRAAAALGAGWWRFVPVLAGTPGVRGWTPVRRDDEVPKGPSYGVGLASRLPVREWHVRRFAAAPGRLPLLVPTGGRPRAVLVPDEPRAAVAAVVEGPAGPFTVVATHLSFVPGFNVRQLRALVRWAATLPSPAVLLGDLNLPGRLPARLTGWTPLATARTYPSFGPRVQLDHVLASGIPPGTTQVWRLGVSDHCALAADVDL